MSFLGIEFFGYRRPIAKRECSIPDTNITVKCHSNIWTTPRKVTTFVIAALAAIVCSGAVALYCLGNINLPTLIALTSTGGVVLLLDSALIINYIKKHNLFVTDVAKVIKFGRIPSSEKPSIRDTMLGLDAGKAVVYDKHCIIHKTSEKSVTVHYFESIIFRDAMAAKLKII